MQNIAIFHHFRKKLCRVRSCKIPPKRQMLKRPASGESWDNSPPGMSGFWVSRMSSCTLKLCRKSKHRKKCESTCAFWRNLTPAKKAGKFQKGVWQLTLPILTPHTKFGWARMLWGPSRTVWVHCASSRLAAASRSPMDFRTPGTKIDVNRAGCEIAHFCKVLLVLWIYL